MGELMTIKEVARALKVSVKTIRRLPLPFTRVGRQRRYRPRIVEKYLERQASRPDAWRRGNGDA